jgi:enoyl-CoA hydratase/carnithine racemase
MDLVITGKSEKICFMTINRPDKQNALSLELMQEMKQKLDLIANDKDIQVLIIRGKGKAFCSGHDLRELVGKNDISYYQHIFSTCSELMQAIAKLPQPVIAMVHGVATAAGCQLVASCDLAIADEHAMFATPGVKIGLFCSTPMIPLIRLIGRRRALDMLLTGRFVSAEEAKNFGLINKVVSIDELEKETKKLALTIANYSRFTIQFGKRAFYDQLDLCERDAYTYGIKAISKNCMNHDAQEGMRAFLEKRKPQWKT